MKIPSLIIMIFLVIGTTLKASSVFCLERENEILVVKSTAWVSTHCYLLVNKKGVSKKAFRIGFNKRVKWKSKFGSVTFNQVSQGLPNGGMNEKGLVIEVTSNSKITSQNGGGAKVSEIQWVQYNLDMFASVEEVIEGLETTKIKQIGKGLIYFICDSTGDKAVIEILNGQAKVYRNETLPVPALTNTLYEKATLFSDHPERYKIDHPQNSVNRFLSSKKIITDFKTSQKNKIDFAFDKLNLVKQNVTMFEIVYDLKSMRIYFKTKDSPSRKWIDLQVLVYGCENVDISVEINNSCLGVINSCLSTYGVAQNKKLANTAYNSLVKDGSLRGIYRIFVKLFYVNRLGRYPKRFKCK